MPVKIRLMPIRQIDPGTADYKQMIRLRDEILRKPLGLSFSKDELEQEKNDILIGAFDDGKLIGCCVLTQIDKTTARLRQMAVQSKIQRMGLGASLMYYAENIARDKGFKQLILHARTASAGFYEKLGYKITSEKFIEVNTPHYLMTKNLY